MSICCSSGLVMVVCLVTMAQPGIAARADASADKPKQTDYFPPPENKGGWRALVKANTTPTAQQKRTILDTTAIDWDKLLHAWRHCDSFGGPSSLLVIRRGWVVGEWHNFTSPRGIASCTKSLTALCMAKLFDLSDAGKLPKKIAIDDEAWRFLPAKWAEAEPARKQIKLRHLLTMTSGLTPYDGPYQKDYPQKIHAQSVEAPPGSVWAYASVPVDMLSLVIENVTGRTQEQFFHEQIGSAIGAARLKWGQFDGHTGGSGGPEGGARFPARELARVGYLVLREGAWEKDGKKQQVISAARSREFTRWAPFLEKARWRKSNFAWEPNANQFYGHLWWTNRTGQALGKDVPRDAVYMSGWGKQACFVVPSLDLVVVRLGPNRKLNEHPEYYRELWSRLLSAVKDADRSHEPGKTDTVERWDTWEFTLESSRAVKNPFRDVTLTATFTHPQTGKQISVSGFHDGERTWRVRFMPVEVGTWAYVTRSNDPDLDGRRGRIDCIRPRQAHLHGPLRPDGFHFRHPDGTRRFLISTRLSCQFAKPEVRKKVIAFLRDAKINRVLFVIGGVHGTIKDLYGPGLDFDRYDVSRFRAIDTFIDELRRSDILAAPYFYYFNDRVQGGMTVEQDKAFIRYGMARFGAYANVMPVLANEVEQKHTRRRDHRYNLASHRWANELGPFLKQCAVFGQAVTVHNPMETDLAVRPGFYTLLRDWPFPWADYMLRQAQVGSLGALAELSDDVPENKTPTYNERALARHNQLLIDLRRFKVPVMNEEPGYEMDGKSWDGKKRDPRPWNSQSADSLRATFWTATMAGACTMWGSPATYVMDDPLPKLKERTATPGHLRVLSEVMSSIPYWEMKPANEVVSANAVTIDRVAYRTTFALAKQGVCYLVYASRGGSLDIVLDRGDYLVRRIDPRTGKTSDLGTTTGGKFTVKLPGDQDALLLIRDRRLAGRSGGKP